MINWTEDDNRYAAAQGWGLFETDYGLQIQRIDDPPNCGYLVQQEFEWDDDAMMWVAKQALAGDDVCIRAIQAVSITYRKITVKQ